MAQLQVKGGQLHIKGGTKVPEIRKGDTVVVLTGKDAGKRGVIEQVLRNLGGPARTKARGGGAWRHLGPVSQVAVVVEGLNIAKRHTKPRQTASSSERLPSMQQGGILEIAKPFNASKVMVVCSHCDKPTRIGHTLLENGQRARTCKHCGERLEVKG